MTTLPDRLLAYAVKQEQVRDALGIPAHDFVDQQEIDDLREAAAALSGGEAEGEAPKPDWRYWYQRTLWWTAKAKEFGYDPDNGVLHASDLTTPQPGGGWVPLRAVLNFVDCLAIDGKGLRHEYVESRSGSMVRIPNFHGLAAAPSAEGAGNA